MAYKRETVTFRDAVLLWKNFAGEKREFNPEGDRNFNIELSEADALELQKQGWNVKPRIRRDEDEDYGPPVYVLKVSVSYKVRAPQVWLISSGGRTMLGEGLVGMLDQLDDSKVDLIISAYDWEVRGNTGRKAYLQSLYFTIYEDELALEYANVPQLSVAGGDAQPALPSAEVHTVRTDYDWEGQEVPS